MYKKFKQFIYHNLIPLLRFYKYLQWLNYQKKHKKICLIIGAGPTKYAGWFSTDIHTLDITKEEDFKKYFSKRKINKILAEHVLEHLPIEEIKKMLVNFYSYSEDNLNIRVAVPDGYHSNEKYIEKVKPGGSGEGSYDHKHLFNYRSLSDIFEKSGFKANPVEYWSEEKNFNTTYKNDENGFIKRSFINDSRNSDGTPNYTSLIIDFTKK